MRARFVSSLICVKFAYALLAVPAFADACIGRTNIEIVLSIMPPGGGPLHDAVIVGSLAKVEQAIRTGIDVNKVDDGGATPLFHAVGLGYNEIARFLITHGADINARNSQQFTPLHIAALGCNQEMVKALLEKGADVNATSNDENGYTPLHSAISGGSPLPLIKLLVEQGADLNARGTPSACTPLCLANKMGRQDIAKYLRGRGAH